jgi:hypothetical protein
MAASVLLADSVYNVSCNIILDSAMRAISAWDIVTSMIKCWVFGTIISTGKGAAPRQRLACVHCSSVLLGVNAFTATTGARVRVLVCFVFLGGGKRAGKASSP